MEGRWIDAMDPSTPSGTGMERMFEIKDTGKRAWQMNGWINDAISSDKILKTTLDGHFDPFAIGLATILIGIWSVLDALRSQINPFELFESGGKSWQLFEANHDFSIVQNIFEETRP